MSREPPSRTQRRSASRTNSNKQTEVLLDKYLYFGQWGYRLSLAPVAFAAFVQVVVGCVLSGIGGFFGEDGTVIISRSQYIQSAENGLKGLFGFQQAMVGKFNIFAALTVGSTLYWLALLFRQGHAWKYQEKFLDHEFNDKWRFITHATVGFAFALPYAYTIGLHDLESLWLYGLTYVGIVLLHAARDRYESCDKLSSWYGWFFSLFRFFLEASFLVLSFLNPALSGSAIPNEVMTGIVIISFCAGLSWLIDWFRCASVDVYMFASVAQEYLFAITTFAIYWVIYTAATYKGTTV